MSEKKPKHCLTPSIRQSPLTTYHRRCHSADSGKNNLSQCEDDEGEENSNNAQDGREQTEDSSQQQLREISNAHTYLDLSTAAGSIGRKHQKRSTYFNPRKGVRKAWKANRVPSNIRLGIACMDKKLKAPTMQKLIAKFESFGMFEVVVFTEDTILNKPPEDWPFVECIIIFFSGGFPLDKACQYQDMHPATYFLTEPSSQVVLLDRRDVYKAMSRNNIPTPRHVFCSRDGHDGAPEPVVIQDEESETITINGVTLAKPFVEKPCDAENHEVYIY